MTVVQQVNQVMLDCVYGYGMFIYFNCDWTLVLRLFLKVLICFHGTCLWSELLAVDGLCTFVFMEWVVYTDLKIILHTHTCLFRFSVIFSKYFLSWWLSHNFNLATWVRNVQFGSILVWLLKLECCWSFVMCGSMDAYFKTPVCLISWSNSSSSLNDVMWHLHVKTCVLLPVDFINSLKWVCWSWLE